MAANAFPGMDPWFETLWGDTHARLIVYAADQLQPQLPAELVALAETTSRVGPPDAVGLSRPDASVSESDPCDDEDRSDDGLDDEEGPGPVVATAVATRPLVFKLPSRPQVQRRVAVRERGEPRRLVTAIEVLSPWNKRPGPGRVGYLQKRERLLQGDSSVVEIDLVRAGRPHWPDVIDPATSLPETIYRACVYRSYSPDRAELYPIALRERLPAISVPLRSYDPADVVLDLQPLVDAVYANSGWKRSRHTAPLDPPLSAEDAAWAAGCLRSKTNAPRP